MQIVEAVDAGVMPVAPFELKRVLPDELDLSEFQIVRNVDRKDDSHAGHLIFAGCAGTHPAKSGRGVMTLLAIGPDDHQFTRSDLLDLCWCGSHSTSRTGVS